MEIKIVRVYLTGGRRINELFEEGERKTAKIRELRTAVQAQDRQMKGWGKDFEGLLREREALRAELKEKEHMLEYKDGLVDKWERMYSESEKARKSMGEKLEHALGALELLKERVTPSATVSREIGGDTSPEGGGKRAAEGVGPYSNFGPLGPTKGGARA